MPKVKDLINYLARYRKYHSINGKPNLTLGELHTLCFERSHIQSDSTTFDSSDLIFQAFI